MIEKIDYNEISRIYDDVRESETEIISNFIGNVKLGPNTRILDIGCGTCNYGSIIQRITRAEVYGIDKSLGMLEKARLKNKNLILQQAEATAIPFEPDYFDFVYLNDVIHHIIDKGKMFSEIYRVLKKGGRVCIDTQSYDQISRRAILKYFPEIEEPEKRRYPDISEIHDLAIKAGLIPWKIDVLFENQQKILDKKFLELVEKKGYSMLYLISEEQYQYGLKKLKQDLEKGDKTVLNSGTSLVWLRKQS